MIQKLTKLIKTFVELSPNSSPFMNPKLMREEQVFKGLLIN
jgi:hypothetical protein